MIVVFGVIALVTGALGLIGLVAGVRARDPRLAFSCVPFLVAAAGFGWGISVVASVSDEITTSRVDRARAVNCAAEILSAGDERARINDAHVYRFRVRVRIPGKVPYETDSTAAVSPLLAGRIGVDRTGYACLADRTHFDQVEILWDQPIH